MSATPTVNGQIIGQAHYATRAVLERLLARTDTSFQQSVALNAIAGNGAAMDRGQLIARMTATLKLDDSTALATIAELTASHLIEHLPDEDNHLLLTDAGRALNRDIRTAVDELTARLYGDLPADDLAAAARVLTLVTARANAELASAQPKSRDERP
ncbi:winged helix DNA-binding protein [Kitasatospora aureofaciens]|uniref:winged helix DNA-binding protein n=1 Tax=Kitasatospora aureofaciens TaxID=1894 RepID=UPI001C4856C4|nr:winged helix DNA-binding protein [Kitasatospora aureofaciens]MBV6699168.1 winged helix DNA-binding protein [Kitasatospora aureofaciens]